MKKSSLKAAVITVLLLVLGTGCAFARETTLIDLKMDSLFAKDSVEINRYGKLNESAGYSDGTIWASEWGFGGWGEDFGDMLLIYPRVGASSGGEGYIYHKIIADQLPDNASVTMSIDLITASRMNTSKGEVWFRMQSKPAKDGAASVTVQPFKIESAPDGLTAAFASTTGWPFTAKTFDRTTGINLEYNTEYTINCTMSMAPSGHYRFVAEVMKDGEKIGAGIVDQFDRVASDTFNCFENVGIVARALSGITEQEPLLYIKNFKITAKSDDEKPAAEFYPENGADCVSRNSDFRIKFGSALEEISAEQIEVSGGAFLENLQQSEDGKELKFTFGNLEANTAYTVKIKNVKAIGAETAYDYDWNFTTDYSTKFGAAYLVADKTNILSQDFIGVDTIKIPLKRQNQAYTDNYLNGGLASSYETVKYYSGNVFETDEEGWLYAKQSNGQWETSRYGNLSRRIPEGIKDGETMEVSVPLKLIGGGVFEEKALDTHIRLTDDSGENRLTLLSYKCSKSGAYTLSLGGINQSVSGTSAGTYAAVVSEPDYKDEELKLVATLSPGAGTDKYNVFVKLVKADGTVLISGDIAGGITKEAAESYRNIELESFVEWGIANKQARQLGIKNIYVDILRNSFVSGTNNIYVDYENEDGGEVSATALALIEKKENDKYIIEDAQLFDINKASAKGSIELPVEMNETENRRIKIFILSSEVGMIPLAAESLVQ